MSALPLGLVVDPQNDKLLSTLRDLENYNFDHITRSTESRLGWTSDKTKAVEIETKRFFALAFLDSGNYHIPEADVDEYWHRMILHTHFYKTFCSDLFGEFYHHTPEPIQDAINDVNRTRTQKVVAYWFGSDWSSLVKTCTQCRGPLLVGNAAPESSTLPIL